MSPSERNELLERYRTGYDEVADALKGIPADVMGHHPLSGKWSVREIVHHLGDSETWSGIRLRKLLTEAYPIIYAYDQEAWAILLRYNLREDIQPSLDAFRAARQNCQQILESLGDEDWRRAGWHTEHGVYTVGTWLQIYAAHAHDHAAQIRRLKEAITARA